MKGPLDARCRGVVEVVVEELEVLRIIHDSFFSGRYFLSCWFWVAGLSLTVNDMAFILKQTRTM